jgi:hypothetical protein
MRKFLLEIHDEKAWETFKKKSKKNYKNLQDAINALIKEASKEA